MATSEAQKFRANVGIVVLNDRWEVLALERIDEDALEQGEKKGTGRWQMPQGGLDEGEELQEAWKRELREEIHVSQDDVVYIDSYPDWLVYELPKKDRKPKHGRGQVQRWFFVRLITGTTIRLETKDPKLQEFFDQKWISLGALAAETWEIRRPIYLKLALYLEALRAEAGVAETVG